VKRPDLLHAVLGRLQETAARQALPVDPRAAECAGPGEYVVTVYGTHAHVSRFVKALRRDEELQDAQLVEDMGKTNPRRRRGPDTARPRHWHVALTAPSLW